MRISRKHGSSGKIPSRRPVVSFIINDRVYLNSLRHVLQSLTSLLSLVPPLLYPVLHPAQTALSKARPPYVIFLDATSPEIDLSSAQTFLV
jgi:hypothetical protein